MGELAKLNTQDQRFFKITNLAYWYGLLGHGGAVVFMWWLDLPELALFNLCFSAPAFGLAIFLNKRHKLSWAFSIAVAELLLHQVVATYYLGWDMGAQYFVLYLAGLLFFNPRWSRGVQFSLLGFISVVYVGMFFLFQEPVYQFPEVYSLYIHIIIALSVLIANSLLINFFSKSAYKAEKELVREQSITKRLLKRVESLFGQQIPKEVATEMIESREELRSKSSKPP